VRVRVPASSANLGPGYDSFGLALRLYNEFEASLADAWSVTVSGEGGGTLRSDAENQVARAMARAFAEAGQTGRSARVVCHNGVPVGRGLGSSAAAIVGGLMLGSALLGADLGSERLLELAVELEGHPDNVAAAVFGGFTVSLAEGSAVRAMRVEPASGLAAVIALGEEPLATSEARKALPASVPHAHAARNAARAAMVALGIALGDAESLHQGLVDAIHEPYRAALVPDLEEVRSVLADAGAGPAVLSGAGPTVVALVTGPDDDRALERARAIAEAARPALGEIGRGRVLAVGVDRDGARII
jgi:homoserine kinase